MDTERKDRSLELIMPTNRIEFKPPPGVDPILDVLRKFFMSQIRWIPKQKSPNHPTFTVTRDTFTNPFTPKPLPSPSSLSNDDNETALANLPSQKYTYTITKHTDKRIPFGPQHFHSIKVLAQLDASGAGALVKHHTAASSDGWLPLPTFVTLFGPVPTRIDAFGIGSPRWHTDYQWQTNGKHFDFLALPGELRELVYAHCAPSCRPGHFYHGGWNYAGPEQRAYLDEHVQHVRGAEFDGQGRIVDGGAGAILGLLLTSKRVSGEFAAVLQKACEFRYTDAAAMVRSPPLFGKVVTERPPEGPFVVWKTLLAVEPRTTVVRTLTRLRLELGIETWLTVLRLNRNLVLQYPSLSGGDENIAATWLAQLPGLKSFAAYLGHKGLNTTVAGVPRLPWPCHRFSTGLVLLGLAGVFGHAEEISVEGCISKELRTMFKDYLEGGKTGVEKVSIWDMLGWDGRYCQPPMPAPNHVDMMVGFPEKERLIVPFYAASCHETDTLGGTPRGHKCEFCYCDIPGCIFETNFRQDPALVQLYG